MRLHIDLDQVDAIHVLDEDEDFIVRTVVGMTATPLLFVFRLTGTE